MVNTNHIVGDIRYIALADEGHWMVYELAGLSYDRRRSLVFESDTQIRRVRNYPAGRRSLSDEALYQLSWRL